MRPLPLLQATRPAVRQCMRPAPGLRPHRWHQELWRRLPPRAPPPQRLCRSQMPARRLLRRPPLLPGLHQLLSTLTPLPAQCPSTWPAPMSVQHPSMLPSPAPAQHPSMLPSPAPAQRPSMWRRPAPMLPPLLHLRPALLLRPALRRPMPPHPAMVSTVAQRTSRKLLQHGLCESSMAGEAADASARLRRAFPHVPCSAVCAHL